MSIQILAFLMLAAPGAFVATAIVSKFQPGLRPVLIKKLSTFSTVISIGVALFFCAMAIRGELVEISFFEIESIGISFRLDAVSVIMFTMIAFLSFIIVRYSMNYLATDQRQGIFLGRLAATIAAVQLFVLSGNIGILFISWVLTSMALHRLLIFYPERPLAVIAARKKFIIARLADICLLTAVILIYAHFQTGNLEIIFDTIRAGVGVGETLPGMEIIAVLLALAALLKSAQFPTHGWLIEVMETPTPVSALLHAGLLNAGPFLIIRFAFVMEASALAPLILIIIGAFTALFASVVFLTQTSVKTALGYSSVAHMGFSLLLCGLGIYPAAMLHLVAHSFYKAHSFLSSGSMIDTLRASKITGTKRTGDPFRIALGIVLGFLVYAAFAIAWGIDPQKDFVLFAIGGILVMGLSRLFTSAIDSGGGFKLFFRAGILSVMVAAAFFTLESGTHHLLAAEIPVAASPGLLKVLLISLILLAFGAVVFIQIIAPNMESKPAFRALAVHLRNGFYVNAWFDRMVRSLYLKKENAPDKESNSIVFFKKTELLSSSKLEEQPV